MGANEKELSLIIIVCMCSYLPCVVGENINCFLMTDKN